MAVLQRSPRGPRSIGDELQFHVDRYTEDLVRAGVSPLEARRRARAEFGSVHADGIRLAIGAQRRSVIWLVLRETLGLIAVGVALGIPAVLAVSRYIESQLFGVSPGDPSAIAGAVVVLLLVAAGAGYQPARRASRVDPMIALRYE